jgi:hypothetical protein
MTKIARIRQGNGRSSPLCAHCADRFIASGHLTIGPDGVLDRAPGVTDEDLRKLAQARLIPVYKAKPHAQ